MEKRIHVSRIPEDSAFASQVAEITMCKGALPALHRVLTLYRVDKDHPMGHKGIEITFEMNKDDHFLGWLAFKWIWIYLDRNMALIKRD